MQVTQLGNVLWLAISITFASLTFASPLVTGDIHSHTLTIAHQELGLLTIAFEASSESPSLRLISTTPAGVRPGWLCSRGKNIYSVARTGYPDGKAEAGAIFACASTCTNTTLKHIGNVSSQGEGACHCGVSPDGRLLSVANIDGSSVTIHPRYRNGTIGDASHLFTYTLAAPGPGHDDSQIQPNPHQTIFSPSGDYMFVPDRGADLVYVYHIATDKVTRLADVQVLPGTGPRHASFFRISETESLMILVGELDNTLRVYRVAESSALANVDMTLLQTISTLGAGLNRTHPDGVDLASEVAISPDGKYVYAANRHTSSFDSDFLAIYSLDAASTSQPLKWLGRNDTMGKIPRHFSLSQGEGEYLAVLNQVTNDLQVFGRDIDSGFLTKRLAKLEFGELTTDLDVGPIAVLWN
ncbi:3-carboxy-cis,cis-mucoante lactonizing enzyme [Sarocladium strictum]